jgi:hypothetical protein
MIEGRDGAQVERLVQDIAAAVKAAVGGGVRGM